MKTILVSLDQHSYSQAVLEIALILGRSFESYIEGFARGPDLHNLIAVEVPLAVPLSASPPIGFGLRWLTAGGWAWWRPGPGWSGCWDGWDRACGPGHQRGAGRAAAVATQDATGEPRASGCDHVERAQRQPDGAGGSPAP